MFSEDKIIKYIMFLFGFIFIINCAEKRVNLTEAVEKQDINILVFAIKNPKQIWGQSEG